MVKWSRFFCYVLGIVCGSFWIMFGVMEYLSNPASPAGLIEGAIFGLPILLAAFIAFRWILPGSILLILHSIFTSWFITFSRSSLNIRIFLFITLSLPPLIAGSILFSIWHRNKP